MVRADSALGEALTRAVYEGYYSLPRRIFTKDLADELDIFDQSLTERLRRAIIALTMNTLLIVDSDGATAVATGVGARGDVLAEVVVDGVGE